MNQEIQFKKCLKCKEIKSINEFHKDKNRRGGHKDYCKVCIKKDTRVYYLKNTEKIYKKTRRWALNHPEIIKKSKHKWYINHPNYYKNYYLNNFEKIKKIQQKYIFKNPKKVKKSKKQWRLNNLYYTSRRCGLDFNFKLIINFKSEINKKLKNNSKKLYFIKIVSCSNKEYKQKIKQQFYNKPNKTMTWKKWGNGHNHWQIHHICPIAFFNMSDPVEQQQAFHYSNTRPLWYEDHCEEHRKINEHMKQYDPKDVYPWKFK